MTETPDDARDLASRLFAHEKLHALAGGRVKFARTVDRAPHFTVPEGATGTILTPFMSEGVLVAAVRLDTSLAGSVPFEDEVHWTQPMFEAFAQDLELIEIPPCGLDSSPTDATTSTPPEGSSSECSEDSPSGPSSTSSGN